LSVDFVGGPVGHRFRFGGGRGQALPRAAGLTKGRTPKIVDATAGLGRDAFLLASLGAEVTMIERVPEVAALLAEGLARAKEAEPEYAAIVARMTLFVGDAREFLQKFTPEVVLVDPMHPPRGNTALVKQEMRQLRELVGDDPDALDLMRAALAAASNRVVLKWPIHAPLLDGLPAPSHSIVGKSTRYDVFVVERKTGFPPSRE
jgi:16S rRNA (guanine1516-N2)-methyltransferase